MERQFLKTLRLNILELMNYSKVRKNRKRLSDRDVLGQIHGIYQLAERKPTALEIGDSMVYLLNRNLIEESQMGEVPMYHMTEDGRELLKGIYEDDDTAII